MRLDYIDEAFKKLELLNEDTFNFSPQGMNDLESFLDQDDTTELVKVIDPEVKDPDELNTSYVGKVITNCNVCHSNVFTEKEDIQINEDGIVNIEKQCPYCGEFEGFTILGEIVPFDAEASEVNVEVDGEEIPETSEEQEIESNVEDEEKTLDESLNTLIEGYSVSTGRGTPKKPFENLEDAIAYINDGIKNRDSESFVLYNNSDVMIWLDYYRTRDFEGLGYTVSDQRDKSVAFDKEKGLSIVESLTEMTNREKLKARFPELNFESAVTETLEESMNNVNVETDDTIVTVNSDDNGKVTVSTEPKDSSTISEGENVEEGDMIAPLQDETLSEIEGAVNGESEEATEEVSEEEAPAEEDEFTDVELEEVDEEGLDDLGESYFKRVYENVDSYKTTSIYTPNNKMIVEGILTFTSGTSKKTGFIFEAAGAYENGKILFEGFNPQLSRGKKAFSLLGQMKGSKFLPESLGYNYHARNVENVEDRVSGKITRK